MVLSGSDAYASCQCELGSGFRRPTALSIRAALPSLGTKLSVRSPWRGLGRRCSARSRFAEAVKLPNIQCTPPFHHPPREPRALVGRNNGTSPKRCPISQIGRLQASTRSTVKVGPLSAATARFSRAGPRRARSASRCPHGPFRPKRQKRRSQAGPALICGGLGRRSVMTILQKLLEIAEGHPARVWHRFGHGDQAVRYTEAWEHENFAEEQARWERSDPEYARICEQVRQARKRGGEGSLRADEAKAAWDARVYTQRHASDDAQRAHHALKADQTAGRRQAASRAVSSQRRKDQSVKSTGTPRLAARAREGQDHVHAGINADHDQSYGFQDAPAP